MLRCIKHRANKLQWCYNWNKTIDSVFPLGLHRPVAVRLFIQSTGGPCYPPTSCSLRRCEGWPCDITSDITSTTKLIQAVWGQQHLLMVGHKYYDWQLEITSLSQNLRDLDVEGSETLKLVHPGAPKWPDSTFLSKKSTDTRVVVKAKLNVLWHSKPNRLITAASYSSRAVMAVIFEAGIKGENINQLFVIIPSSSQNKVINDHIILRYWSFVSSRCVNTQTVKPQCLHYSFQRDILMFNSFIKDINPDKIISGSISGPIELDDHIQTIPESTGQPRVKGHAELCGSVTQTWTSGCCEVYRWRCVWL